MARSPPKSRAPNPGAAGSRATWLQSFNGSAWSALREFVLGEKASDGVQHTRQRTLPTVMGQEHKLSAAELQLAKR